MKRKTSFSYLYVLYLLPSLLIFNVSCSSMGKNISGELSAREKDIIARYYDIAQEYEKLEDYETASKYYKMVA